MCEVLLVRVCVFLSSTLPHGDAYFHKAREVKRNGCELVSEWLLFCILVKYSKQGVFWFLYAFLIL